MIKHLNIIYDKETAGQSDTISIFDIDKIINGSVQNITCTCLDRLKYSDRKKIVIELIHKIAMNGSLSLKFLNLDLIGNKIKKKELNGEKFSNIIISAISAWDYAECTEFVSSLSKDILIENIGFDNTHTVIQLKKI